MTPTVHWSKQIGMRAGADQVQVVALHLVDQQPIGLNVAVAELAPLAAQRVILIAGR